MSTRVESARAGVLAELGADDYLLAPGRYTDVDAANYMDAQTIEQIGNALLVAFASGLLTALAEPARRAGKSLGRWISDRVSSWFGSEAREADAITDEAVAAAIEKLAVAIGRDNEADPEVAAEVQARLAEVLSDRYGLTQDRAEAVSRQARSGVTSML